MFRIALMAALGAFSVGTAEAQSLSPMEAQIVTFGEIGAVRTSLRNPYDTARRFEIEVFDLGWQPVADVKLSRQRFSLPPGETTSVFALLPVQSEEERSVYVCATALAYRPSSAGIRGQVCGRYRVVQRSL